MGVVDDDQQLRKAVAARLRAAIDGMRLDYKDAAKKAGIPYRTLQNYIAGVREPKAGALSKMSARLGISPTWVLFGEGAMLRDAQSIGITTESPSEEAVLLLFRALSEAEQREIHQSAEEKKRLREVERKLEEVSAQLASRKIAP